MQYKVNDTCIGCNTCVHICPEGFKMNADLFAEGIILNPNIVIKYKEKLNVAKDACPVSAIYIDE